MKKLIFSCILATAVWVANAQVDKILGPWTAIDPDTDKPYARPYSSIRVATACIMANSPKSWILTTLPTKNSSAPSLSRI